MQIFYKNDTTQKNYDPFVLELEPDYLYLWTGFWIFKKKAYIPRRDISNWLSTRNGVHITCGKVQHKITAAAHNVAYLDWWYLHG